MVFTWEDGHSRMMKFGQSLCGLKHKGKRPTKCFITKNAINKGRVQGDKISSYLLQVQKALDHSEGNLYCYLEPNNVI